MKIKSYVPALLVLFIIAVLHYLGCEYAIYDSFPQLDVINHFLGGLWIALSIWWLITRLRKGKGLPLHLLGAILVVSALAIGIAWEAFEAFFQLSAMSTTSMFIFDTVKDLAMDALGAIFATVSLSIVKARGII